MCKNRTEKPGGQGQEVKRVKSGMRATEEAGSRY
jgi:hypothetical protein